MLLKVDLRQNDAFLFLECQLRGRVHLGGGHGTITVVCLIPCVHLCLIAWYHYQIQVCLRVHIWKWWKGKWNIQSRRLFCGILHLAAEQCWASVLKLWIIYKQKYLQRSVDAHVGVTARKTLLMEVRGCHCECACEIGRRDQSKELDVDRLDFKGIAWASLVSSMLIHDFMPLAWYTLRHGHESQWVWVSAF